MANKIFKNPLEQAKSISDDSIYFGVSPLWSAVASGDLNTIDDFYKNKNWKPNQRFNGFNQTHSLLINAARNKQWDAFKKLQDYGEEVLPSETKELGDLLTIRDGSHIKNFDLNVFNNITDDIAYGRDNGVKLGTIQNKLLKKYGPEYTDLVRHALSKWAE